MLQTPTKRKYMLKTTIILTFFMISILIPSKLLIPGNKEEVSIQSDPSTNLKENNFAGLGPLSAGAHSFDAYVHSDDFNSGDPVGTGNYDWSETTPSGTSYTYSAAGDYMDLDASSGSAIAFLAFDLNLLNDGLIGYTILNAQINITWSYSDYSGSFVKWQYNKDGAGWTDISGTSRTSSFASTTDSFNLGDANIAGTESTLYIRLYADLQRFILSHAYVRLYEIEIGNFRSTITDTTPLTRLDQNVIVYLDLYRCGTDSGLSTSLQNYRIYYGLGDSSIDGTNSYTTATGSFNGDHGTLTFTISESVLTENSTLYYKILIMNHYWSSQYSIVVNDELDPAFSGGISLSHDNATLELDDNLIVSGSCIDTGGYGLRQVELYYGDSLPVSNNPAENNGSKMEILSGDSDTFSLTITSSNLIYEQPIYLVLYLSDNSYNTISSNVIEITPGDFTGPIITPLSTTTHNIGYHLNKLLQFQIKDAVNMSGLNASTISAFYKLNNNTFENAIELTSISNQSDVWSIQMSNTQYSYKDQVYIWCNAKDNKSNPTGYSFSFHVIDQIAPQLSVIQSAPDSNLLTAIENIDLLISVLANDTSEGIGENVTLFFKYAIAAFAWNTLPTMYPAVKISAGKYKFTVDQSNLTSGFLYYIIRAYDQSGNYVEISTYVNIKAAPPANTTTTTSSTSNTNTTTNSSTNSNGILEDGNMLLYILIGVGSASLIGLGVFVMKRKNQGFYENVTKKDLKTVQKRNADDGRSSDIVWDDEDEIRKTRPVKAKEKTTETDSQEQVPETDSEGDIKWDDADLSTSISNNYESKIGSVQSTTQEIPIIGSDGASLNKYSAEMKELYDAVQEFIEFDDTTSAMKTYDMLIRVAEKDGNEVALDFFKAEKDLL
jgi:hypothetical protein